MTAFDTAFDRVIGAEGGYVNNPADPGGETNWGISKRSYPNVDIKGLTIDGAKGIYRRDYWDPLMLDSLHPSIAFQLFDFAVNSGVAAAKRVMSTLNATHDPAVNVIHILAARLTVMTSASGWPTFGKGWARRIASDLELAASDLA